METPSQRLHRVTSYRPGPEWDGPFDYPGAAGVVEGRLHLLAYALGAAATGMTFYDSEIPALVGEPADGLLFTCVGVPEYRSATGGAPGSPTAVRRVEERFKPPDTPPPT